MFRQLEVELDKWANYIQPMYEDQKPTEDITPVFVDTIQSFYRSKGLDEEQIQAYELANPSWMSVGGLLRYWRLKEQGRL